MKTFKHTLKTIILLALVVGCANNSETSQEEERLELDNLKEEIEQLISTESCTENSNCDFIAFGSKPCGGPWSYLVYSTSIDVELLKAKVATYNNYETAHNIKWGIVSDCMAVTPPISVECIDGACTAIY
ncbi:hypothetical protein [Lutibacter sp.]